MGHAVISGNLSQGVVVFTNTVHHIGPFFWWDAMVRRTWTWRPLCGYDWRNAPKHLLECVESLIELAVRGNKVNQHWW